MSVSLELLTDEAILDYTRRDGRDMIVYDHRDMNLRGNMPEPVPGGVFDKTIFGSAYVDRCYCGYLKRPSADPCPSCGCRVFTKEEALRRFARVELPFYYLNDLRFDIFYKFFEEIFKDCTIVREFLTPNLKALGYSETKTGKKFNIKVFDSCQFDYNPKTKELKVSEFIDDESKCSYEGLMKIIQENFPEYLQEYKKLVNRYYLILPVVMRPFTIKKGTAKKKSLGNHPMTLWYTMLIRFCCPDDPLDSNHVNYDEVMESLDTPGERVRYTALLRAFINSGKKESTSLLNTTKENYARELYSVRTKNSARCPIVPSTTLAIDELGVPASIAYEMCREGFAQYLQDELGFDKKEAKKSIRLEALDPELQEKFKEYAEKQFVIVTRQPALHEYSMYCMKLRLVDGYSIHFPIAVCEPLNADFDGDTTSIQLCPPDVAEDVYKKMSPRYNNVYKKNNKPIFPFNHETLNGLAVMTEFTPDDPNGNELDDPRHYYTDYVEVLKDCEVEHKIKIGTPITFTGKVGGEEYKNKVTCYGKLKLSKILDADIDNIGIDGKTKILKNPKERMDAAAAARLSSYLNKEEDGVEKRLAIQKAALKAVTAAGVVTFDYKTLYVNTDTDTYKEICKIADSEELTDQQKIALLTTKYAEYEKEIEGKFSDDLKKELDRAARVKITSISALNMPQLIISGVEERPIITRGNLLAGYGEKDMIYHSIENRSLQSIKNSGVPSSGYLTRQISFVLNNYIFHEGEDPDNPGLLIPRYKAAGRTAPNGVVYTEVSRTNEDDLVLVRSIVTKNKGDLNVVTPDLIGTRFRDLGVTDGTAIGLSFATSFTEATTQGALGLKHGGHERVLDKSGYLVARKPCTFREEGKWFYLKMRGKEEKYPRPDNLVTLGKDTFEAGENICVAYNTVSPIAQLNSTIRLIRARGSNATKYFEKDNVIVSDCYALEDGEIRYVETPEGDIEVHIGSGVYQYNPLCMYYFPDGAQVKKYDRICNGVVNMNHVISKLGDDIRSEYLVFRKQMYTLTDKDFAKSNGTVGITTMASTQEEIIELLFRGLISVSYDPETAKVEEIDFQGTMAAIQSKKSFYSTLSFGHSSKVISKAIKGDINFEGDVMTETVLGLLLNNTLD